jgi:GNAT superfamily N-acetyltransferase
MSDQAKGRCFQDSFLALLGTKKGLPYEQLQKFDRVLVSHGQAQGVAHCWLELDSGNYQFVYEPQMDKLMDYSVWAKYTRPTTSYKLTKAEWVKLRNTWKHLGPYTNDELRILPNPPISEATSDVLRTDQTDHLNDAPAGDVRYWKNPTKDELVGLVQRFAAKMDEDDYVLRGLLHRRALYVWRAIDATHGQIERGMVGAGIIVDGQNYYIAFGHPEKSGVPARVQNSVAAMPRFAKWGVRPTDQADWNAEIVLSESVDERKVEQVEVPHLDNNVKIPVFVNPRRDDIFGLLLKDKYKHTRLLVTDNGKGDVYAWTAYYSNHDGMAELLGLPDSDGGTLYLDVDATSNLQVTPSDGMDWNVTQEQYANLMGNRKFTGLWKQSVLKLGTRRVLVQEARIETIKAGVYGNYEVSVVRNPTAAELNAMLDTVEYKEIRMLVADAGKGDVFIFQGEIHQSAAKELGLKYPYAMLNIKGKNRPATARASDSHDYDLPGSIRKNLAHNRKYTRLGLEASGGVEWRPDGHYDESVSESFTTKLGFGGIPEGFKIIDADGGVVIGRTGDMDMPGEKAVKTRGEVFWLETPKARRRGGHGKALFVAALRLMQGSGATTVALTPTSADGRAFNAAMVKAGVIDGPVRKVGGREEYTIGRLPADEAFRPQLRVTNRMRASARDNAAQVAVKMDPEAYLKLTATDDYEELIKKDAKSLDQYNQFAKAGDIHITPFLRIAIADGKAEVVSHEGRHRAAALIKAGQKQMVVHLEIRDGDGSTGKFKRQLRFDDIPAKIKGQFSDYVLNKSAMKPMKVRHLPESRHGFWYEVTTPEDARVLATTMAILTPTEDLQNSCDARRNSFKLTESPGAVALAIVEAGEAEIARRLQEASTRLNVYRGTGKEGIERQRLSDTGVYGKGLYFYTNPKSAAAYAERGGGIMTGYVFTDDPGVEVHGDVVVVRDLDYYNNKGVIPNDMTLDLSKLPELAAAAIKLQAGELLESENNLLRAVPSPVWSDRIEETIDREGLKARLEALKAEAKPLFMKGGLTSDEAEKFQALTREMEAIRFDLAKEPAPEDTYPPDKVGTLSPAVVLQARKDIRANRDIYLAIADAATGVFHGAYTVLDKIVKGQHSKITARELYDAFAETRAALKKQYGHAITLYRATGAQIKKPTTNWATTEAFARQFGAKVIRKQFPVDKVLAVNVGLRGYYHEVIVLTEPLGESVEESARVTVTMVNKALKAKGYAVEVVKGVGYWYFSGPDAAKLHGVETGVMVPRLSDLSVEEWVAEFENKRKESGYWRGESKQTVSEDLTSWFGASKVVDADGKPLRVYHGTINDRAGFTAFDRKMINRNGFDQVGHWFDTRADMAARFGHAVYPVYLKIENPLVVTAKKVHDAFLREMDAARINSLNKKMNEPMTALSKAEQKELAILKKRQARQENDDAWYQVYSDYQKRAEKAGSDRMNWGDQFRAYLQKKGYDGIRIVQTTADQTRTKLNPRDVWIAFTPQQIKSVFNKGDYSDSPDITEAGNLKSKLMSLRGKLAKAAQKEYDEWQGEDDPEIGNGGICDRVANAMGSVLASAGIDTTDGGQDGDDHAYLVAYSDTEAFGVDIPPGTYERGGGYNWTKIEGVTMTANDVEIWPIDRDWLEVDESVEVSRRGEKFEATDNGVKVGQAFASRRGDVVILDAIDVDENHRRKGYATALLKAVARYMKSIGVRKLHSSNEGSGTVQLLDKVFGRANVKHFHKGEEISYEDAVQVMDVDFGYTRSEATLTASAKLDESNVPYKQRALQMRSPGARLWVYDPKTGRVNVGNTNVQPDPSSHNLEIEKLTGKYPKSREQDDFVRGYYFPDSETITVYVSGDADRRWTNAADKAVRKALNDYTADVFLIGGSTARKADEAKQTV